GGLRGHKLDLLYGIGSVLYIALSAVLIMVIYRATVEGWLAPVLPAPGAAGLAWAAGALVVVSAGGALVSDLRGAPRAAGGLRRPRLAASRADQSGPGTDDQRSHHSCQPSDRAGGQHRVSCRWANAHHPGRPAGFVAP